MVYRPKLKKTLKAYPELNRRKEDRRRIDKYDLDDNRRLVNDGAGIIFQPAQGLAIRAYKSGLDGQDTPIYSENRRPSNWWTSAGDRRA